MYIGKEELGTYPYSSFFSVYTRRARLHREGGETRE